MNLADARAAYIPKKRPKRLGRGWGSGHGKTSGRGNKGQQARSGGGPGAGFEGGQMPLYRRLPKRGFNNHRFRTAYAIVNIGQLEGAFGDGAKIDIEAIRGAHLVNEKGPIKVLGGGEVSKKLHVTADRFSESAKRKIEALGGSATALEPPRPVRKPRPTLAERLAKGAKKPGKQPPADEAAKEAPAGKGAKEPKAAKEAKAPKEPKAPKEGAAGPQEAAEPKAGKPPKPPRKPKGETPDPGATN
jgi:large subunit ribosomal protein L15